jgi:hypothetical protein
MRKQLGRQASRQSTLLVHLHRFGHKQTAMPGRQCGNICALTTMEVHASSA